MIRNIINEGKEVKGSPVSIAVHVVIVRTYNILLSQMEVVWDDPQSRYQTATDRRGLKRNRHEAMEEEEEEKQQEQGDDRDKRRRASEHPHHPHHQQQQKQKQEERAAVGVPPHADRASLHAWLCAYWQQHGGNGQAGSAQDMPYELVLPYETHCALTDALRVARVPTPASRQQPARLVCYPHAPTFLLLPYWPELDHYYASYKASTPLCQLHADLVRVRQGEDVDADCPPTMQRADRRAQSRQWREAYLDLHYNNTPCLSGSRALAS